MIRKILIGFTFISILLLLLIVLGIGFLYYSAPDRLNVLIVGTDQRGEERSRADVMMVLSVPKSQKKDVTLLTIPRDSYVAIPGQGMDKATHAYIYGDLDPDEKIGNMSLVQETVEDLLDIPIHATLEFNFVSFSEVVDLVGGVTVDGRKLQGEDALAIVRNRYREGGDFARTEDQRDVVFAVMKKARNRAVAQQIYDHINMSDNARIYFKKVQVVRFGLGYVLGHRFNLSVPEIQEEVVPGAGGRKYSDVVGKELYFWIIDDPTLEEIVSEKMS